MKVHACAAGVWSGRRTTGGGCTGGCDVERAFREFDSGFALECAGDLVHTGPTGTNVGDILIGCKRLPRML